MHKDPRLHVEYIYSPILDVQDLWHQFPSKKFARDRYFHQNDTSASHQTKLNNNLNTQNTFLRSSRGT